MILNRSTKPDKSGDVKIIVPEIQSVKLQNGMELLSVERKHLPIVKVILYTGLGSKYDIPGKLGLAKLFSSMIDEGAGSFDDMQLSDEFDLLGSTLNILIDSDSLTITINSLKENIDRTLELFSLILKEPTFNEKAFDREKKKTLVKLLELKDDNEAIAEFMFKQAVFGNHPYSNPISGYTSTFSNLTPEDVLKYYYDRFPSNDFKFIAVGDVSLNEMESKLNSLFSDWKKSSIILPDIPEPVIKTPKFIFIDKPENVQSEIRFGYLTGKRDDSHQIKRIIMNSIFGGQFTSRLNINLREKKGFTYGIHSAFVNYIEQSFLEIATSVKRENTLQALIEIRNELDLIKKGVTQDELEFTKSSLTKKYPSQFETINHLSLMILSSIKFNLSSDYYSEYLNKLNSYRLEDINTEAENTYSTELSNVVVVGDKNKIFEDLKSFGDFEEKEFNI